MGDLGYTYTKQLFISHQKFNWACCILSVSLTLEGSDWDAGNRGRWSSCDSVSPLHDGCSLRGLCVGEGVRKRLETEKGPERPGIQEEANSGVAGENREPLGVREKCPYLPVIPRWGTSAGP